MKKLFHSIGACLLLGLMFLPFAVRAQVPQMPPIPVDQDVKIGHLDNGLTYYIRHNDYPKGLADFYIAQKVGSILEDDNQRGLAHFLEHMCFNGTENFPGNTLISWLESVGVKFGANLNAMTGIDETIYNICEVPVSRTGVVDTCLLILHDWADGLLLDGAEIDKERGVIHEEWRSRNVGQQRILEQLLPVMYPGDKYGYRMPIGTMEVVDNFPHQALRDYYEKWYRPDLQAIIVVGDIDVNAVEEKIKRIFSPIQMPVNPAKREYFPVSDNEQTIFAIGKDKELPTPILYINFKSEATPDSAKLNLDYLIQLYAIDMIEAMLNARFEEMTTKPGCPFSLAECEYGPFLVAKTVEAFSVIGVPNSHEMIPAFESIYRETLRAQRGGFTVGEYERARSSYLSALEKRYNDRNKTTSTTLVNEYLRNFLDGEPIPGIENEYQIMSMLASQIPVEAINMGFAQMIDDNNIVVLAMVPDDGKFTIPTEAQMAEAMKNVEAEEIEPFVDEMKAEPLIPSLPTPGKIVSTTDDPVYGATVWTLSNGVKVVVKPTELKENEIVFAAKALGGTSTFGPEFDLDLRYLPVAVNSMGLGDYSNSDLTKYLSGKEAAISVDFTDYATTVEGNTVPKDINTLMELIYMTFKDFELTPDDFAANQKMIGGVIRNQESTPAYQFQRQLNEAMYKSPRHYALDLATVEGASRDNILNIIHSRLANAADYTFYFVGNIDLDTFRPLVEQYIATLPADPSKVTTEVKMADLGLITGAMTEKVKTPMTEPQTFVAILALADMPYTSINSKIASAAGQILSARLLKEVREDRGAVYSIGASGFMNRLGEVPVVMQTAFPMKPEMLDEVLAVIAEEFENMAQKITPEELSKVKEFMVKEAQQNKLENSGWLAAMSAYKLRPVDGFNNAVSEIESITPQMIQQFMADVMKQNNYRVFIMEAE